MTIESMEITINKSKCYEHAKQWNDNSHMSSHRQWTDTDVCMYIEEFSLVEIWKHFYTKLKRFTLENTLAFIQSQQ